MADTNRCVIICFAFIPAEKWLANACISHFCQLLVPRVNKSNKFPCRVVSTCSNHDCILVHVLALGRYFSHVERMRNFCIIYDHGFQFPSDVDARSDI